MLHMCDVDESTFASGWDVMIEARRVQHRFEVAMDQCLEAYGISYAQYRAFLVLLGNNDMHISALARRLRVTRQAALATVTKLARVDLVTLERESHATYVVVTPLARKRLAGLAGFANMPDKLEDALTAAERGRLVALLRKADRSLSPPRRPTWWLDD
jgi:DNA-binding MarR family transcriptional regulator